MPIHETAPRRAKTATETKPVMLRRRTHGWVLLRILMMPALGSLNRAASVRAPAARHGSIVRLVGQRSPFRFEHPWHDQEAQERHESHVEQHLDGAAKRAGTTRGDRPDQE